MRISLEHNTGCPKKNLPFFQNIISHHGTKNICIFFLKKVPVILDTLYINSDNKTLWTTDRTEKDSEVYIGDGMADIDHLFQSD